jgi:hypothetical protein
VSLVISRDIVLTTPIVVDGNLPLIGWHNVVTAAGISAGTANAAYPASNLANPQTFSRWQAGDTTEQYLTLSALTPTDLDYLGIAAHNLASAGISVSIDGKLGEGDWFELVQEVQLPNDGPAMFRWETQSLSAVRLHLRSGDAAARIAVAYLGKLLVMERKIWQGQTPPNLGRMSRAISGKAESGQFLGRSVLSEWVEIKVPLSLLDPAWFRENMVPFFTAARNVPFFFAWRPQDYPFEVGYLWFNSDPVPTNESPTGLIATTLDLRGVV